MDLNRPVAPRHVVEGPVSMQPRWSQMHKCSGKVGGKCGASSYCSVQEEQKTDVLVDQQRKDLIWWECYETKKSTQKVLFMFLALTTETVLVQLTNRARLTCSASGSFMFQVSTLGGGSARHWVMWVPAGQGAGVRRITSSLTPTPFVFSTGKNNLVQMWGHTGPEGNVPPLHRHQQQL